MPASQIGARQHSAGNSEVEGSLAKQQCCSSFIHTRFILSRL